jgi:hypothetical protein
MRDRALESAHSSFLENMREHVFISHILQEAWFSRDQRVKVLRSEVDDSGYDLVFECGGIVRHIQLKSSRIDATTASQTVNLSLAEKPAGCVLWLLWEEDQIGGRMKFGYLFFGGGPRERLPDVRGFPVGRHSKGDIMGVKKERPAIRVIRKNQFQRIADIKSLLEVLFGPVPSPRG